MAPLPFSSVVHLQPVPGLVLAYFESLISSTALGGKFSDFAAAMHSASCLISDPPLMQLCLLFSMKYPLGFASARREGELIAMGVPQKGKIFGSYTVHRICRHRGVRQYHKGGGWPGR